VPSLSGLGVNNRIRARERAVQAAELARAHRDDILYSQEARPRWEGISKKRRARRGEFPKQADCSSFVTWCLWNGLFLRFEVEDIVNGADWKGGFTGTLLDHGKKVRRPANMLPGDLVHYDPDPPKFKSAHVTIYVRRQNGVPMVISLGSDACPCFVKYDYRPVREIRRYI
jgi:cell wall-associated NlpC family hydrolase